MFQPIIERRYLWEIPLTTVDNGQIYNMTVAPQILLDAYVYGIATYLSTTMGYSPNNAPVVSSAEGANVLMTLQALEDSDQFIWLAPYTDFTPSVNNGAIRIFKPRKVNWSKSYVQLINSTGVTAGHSVIIDVFYKK